MSGFKVILKVTAQGFSKERLEGSIKNMIEQNPLTLRTSGISVLHIKAKGTNVLDIIDPIVVLEQTINTRNQQLWKTEKSLLVADEQVSKLESQIEDLLRIIRDKEFCSSNDFCTCNDWRSIGSDPVSGDKLKRCNICERVGVR